MHIINLFFLLLLFSFAHPALAKNDRVELRWTNFKKTNIYTIEWQKETSLINDAKKVKNSNVMKTYWNALKELSGKNLSESNTCKLRFEYKKLISQKESYFKGCTDSDEFSRILIAFESFLNLSKLQN
jgi:hypothetical protein